MAITRKTAEEFAADIESGIISRNPDYDTKVGPIPDLVIQPLAPVLEMQNERIRTVQNLLSLTNDGSFTDSDLDEFVFNESMVRLTGGRASATLIFSTLTAPTIDVTVKAGFPVATLADEESGTSITFVTVEDTTLVAAQAAAYYNPDTQRYELPVLAQSVTGASANNVAPNRIVRPLRALSGFDSVFNRDSASGGRDAELNGELIARYYLSLVGTSPGVVNGVQKIIRDNYPQVIDSNEVFGNNPLNTRAATDGGAVDVYYVGEALTTKTENIIFSGVDQLITLSKQPVVSISAAGAYVQDIDFDLQLDTSGYAGSVRAESGLRFIPGGSAPAIGATVSVTYIYDALATELQAGFTDERWNAPGRDILFKRATAVDTTLTATLKVRPGFSSSVVLSNVREAILTLINNLNLDGDIEVSDIQAVVRAYSSVDNFVISNVSKVGSTGTTDISIGANEYAQMATGDLIITVV